MNLISRSKFNPLYILGYGLILVLEALFIFITLGFFTLNLSLRYTMWFAFREADKARERKEKQEMKEEKYVKKLSDIPVKYVRGNGDNEY